MLGLGQKITKDNRPLLRFNPNTTAFFDVATGVSASEQAKFNRYFNRWQDGSVNGTNPWAKLLTLKRFAGSTAAQHAVDLKTPGLNSGIDVNTPTHGQNTVTTSAGNYWNQGFAHNQITSATSFTVLAFGYTDTSFPASRSLFGSFIGGANIIGIESNIVLDKKLGYFLNGGTVVPGSDNAISLGVRGISRIDNGNGKFYMDGTIVPMAISGAGTLENIQDYLGCLNVNNASTTQDLNGAKLMYCILSPAITDQEYADIRDNELLLNADLGL